MTNQNGAARVGEEPLLVSAQNAAKLCGVSTRTWRRWVAMGLAPQPIRIGRSSRWALKALQAWVRHELQQLHATSGPQQKKG